MTQEGRKLNESDTGRELNESDTGRKGSHMGVIQEGKGRSLTRVTWLFCYQGALTAFL